MSRTRRGRQCAKAANEIAAERLAARHPETEVRKASAQRRLGLEHGPQQGRDQDDPRHAVLGEQSGSAVAGSRTTSSGITTVGTPRSSGPKISQMESTKLVDVF